MEKGARYVVQTRYGTFSLDEGSYRDYLAGRSWIDWPPQRDPNRPAKQEALPPDISEEALKLRERAKTQPCYEILRELEKAPACPCKAHMHDISVDELCLSVRASNGIKRAGALTFGQLHQLMQQEGGLRKIRNIGEKSVKEIEETFMMECYAHLLAYEKAEFWQTALDL